MRRVRDDRGATAVEFALITPVLVLLLGGLSLFALRGVHSALAQNAARAALRTAVLPVSTGDRAVRPDEVCVAALRAIPGVLRPAPGGCNDGTTAPVPGGLTVQVCPPRCDAALAAVACPTSPTALGAPGRVRALTGARARVVPLAVGSSPDATPTPEPSESSTRQPTFGGLLTPTSTPAVATPTPPPAPSPTVLATAVASVGAGVEPPPVPSPTVTVPAPPGGTPIVIAPTLPALPSPPSLLPEPTAGPRPAACGDLLEGRRVAVRVSWSGAALRPLVGLTLGALSDEVATVTAVASGRRE